MAEDDWEKWADDDAQPVINNPVIAEQAQLQQVKQEIQEEKKKQSAPANTQSELKSKQADMNNVLDLFMDESSAREAKVKVADFKVIGENLATKMGSSAVSSVQCKDLLKGLITKLDKKLSFEEWQEVYVVFDAIYSVKKKKWEEEEAKKKKQSKIPPKGINWGKTKGQMDLNDEDAFADDDDFM